MFSAIHNAESDNSSIKILFITKIDHAMQVHQYRTTNLQVQLIVLFMTIRVTSLRKN